VLEPVVARYRGKFKRRYFRADAGFANAEVYEFLSAEGCKYAIRLPTNKELQESIAYLLKRPVGRPPIEVRGYYASLVPRDLFSGILRLIAKLRPPPTAAPALDVAFVWKEATGRGVPC
jgi:hypothetical protein